MPRYRVHDIVLVRTYGRERHKLAVHQQTFLSVIVNKTLENNEATEEDYVLRYEAVVVGEGTPPQPDGRRSRRASNNAAYVVGEKIGYLGTSSRELVHLADMERPRFKHLHLLLTGSI